MQKVKTAVFVKSSSKLSECPIPDLPEYAFIGRSNVGKSSLINLLTNNSKLAKISSKPGKTQLINHFIIDNQWYLVDLPGYGWAKVSKSERKKWAKMIEDYLQRRENLYNVFVLIDSRHEPLNVDLDFIEWLGSKSIPLSIVFTKIDKQGKTKTQQNISTYKKVLKKNWEELPPLFLTSIVTRQGRDDILEYIRSIND